MVIFLLAPPPLAPGYNVSSSVPSSRRWHLYDSVSMITGEYTRRPMIRLLLACRFPHRFNNWQIVDGHRCRSFYGFYRSIIARAWRVCGALTAYRYRVHVTGVHNWKRNVRNWKPRLSVVFALPLLTGGISYRPSLRGRRHVDVGVSESWICSTAYGLNRLKLFKFNS